MASCSTNTWKVLKEVLVKWHRRYYESYKSISFQIEQSTAVNPGEALVEAILYS